MKSNAKQVREKLNCGTPKTPRDKERYTKPLSTENFKRVCGLNGFTPEEFCRHINRHKTTVYKALKNPAQFSPTMKLIENALPVREVSNAA